MIKGVIFDLDGTLIDSEPSWREADFALGKKYNFPINDEFRKPFLGRGTKECIEIIKKTYNLKIPNNVLIEDRLKILYQILLRKLELLPFALKLIQKLQKKGFKLALATSGHKQDMAEKILNKLAVSQYFSIVMSGFEVKHGKPAPDIFLETAKRIGLKPEECIVVEDAVNGIISAKSAGMKVIGVKEDEKLRKNILNANADYVFANLDIPLKSFI